MSTPQPTASPVQVTVGGQTCTGYNVNGETLVPLRWLAEALGASVSYSPASGVTVTPGK